MDIIEKNIIEQDEFELNQINYTPGQLVFKRFVRNKLAVFGMAIVTIMLVFCIVGPFLSPYQEYEIFYVKDRKSVV